MKKIMAVCGQGLGSSLLIEMNIKAVLDELDRIDLTAAHTNINSFDPSDPDLLVVICGADLADAIEFDNKIILDNLLDQEELMTKLQAYLKANNL